MQEKSEYQYFTLSNGIRIIHHYHDNNVAHCGIIINTGTRDETEAENGMAHFIEHIIFKGTKKRKAFHVLSRLENVGADLNAYTSKEETCIYASFLNKYYDRTLELISDITFNSIFPEKEIEKEKDVVFDEINSYKDNPAEEIFDEFEDVVFKGHPLGRNILGNTDTLKTFDRKSIKTFIRNNYHSDEMVICSVGKINFNKLKQIITKYFGDIPPNFRPYKRKVFSEYKAVRKELFKGIYQSHCIIGNIAFKRSDPLKTAMYLLTNILGGPGLNSRLNLGLREKHGLSYNIESNYTTYSDIGVFNIYLGTEKEFLEKSISLVIKELKKLQEKKLGIMQLHIAKQQFIGQLAISYESKLNELLSIGKSYLSNNKIDSLKQINQRIEKITDVTLLEIANKIFDKDQLSTLIYYTK